MTSLTGISIQGNLITPDLIGEINSGELKGQSPESFALVDRNKLADEIAFAWGEAKDLWQIFQRRLTRDQTSTAIATTGEFWAIPLLKLLGYQPVAKSTSEFIILLLL